MINTQPGPGEAAPGWQAARGDLRRALQQRPPRRPERLPAATAPRGLVIDPNGQGEIVSDRQ